MGLELRIYYASPLPLNLEKWQTLNHLNHFLQLTCFKECSSKQKSIFYPLIEG